MKVTLQNAPAFIGVAKGRPWGPYPQNIF